MGKREETCGIHHSMEDDFCAVVHRRCKKAELCDYASVKGLHGHQTGTDTRSGENIQHGTGQALQKAGVKNVYMPLFIPGACN